MVRGAGAGDCQQCTGQRVARTRGNRYEVRGTRQINGTRGFYCLRKTAATESEKIKPLVTEMFLGHTERGMKRHYAERHFALLDEALGVMEGVVGVNAVVPSDAG